MPLDWKDRKGRFPIHYQFDGISLDYFPIVGRIELRSRFSLVLVFFLGVADTSVDNFFVSCYRDLGGAAP